MNLGRCGLTVPDVAIDANGIACRPGELAPASPGTPGRQALLTRTEDRTEALAAFRDRRAPVFRGC